MNRNTFARRRALPFLLVAAGTIALLPLAGCNNNAQEATDTASPGGAATSSNVPEAASQQAAGAQAGGQQNGRNAAANAAAFNAARAKAEGR